MTNLLLDSQKENEKIETTHLKVIAQGAQGIVGLLKKNNQEYIYKISTTLNFLTNHEFIIMEGLKDLEEYCPHFCIVESHDRHSIAPGFRNDDNLNPFDVSECQKSLSLDVLKMEYITDAISLSDLIKDVNVPFPIIFNVIKQVLIAILIAQREKRFAHYDLHTDNILIHRCDANRVHLYNFDENTSFVVPTFGFIPVIIDFGYARSDDINEHQSFLSLSYTDAGYLCPAYDEFADFKVLLVSVLTDLKKYRKTRNEDETEGDDNDIEIFNNIIHNLFDNLDIQWNSGWDTQKKIPLTDQIRHFIENDREESLLFDEFSPFCIDMMQALIVLPLKPIVECDIDMMKTFYRLFVKEFFKIEQEINNTFYSFYIFRKLMEVCIMYHQDYINNPEETCKMVYAQMFSEVASIAKYCTLKRVDFDVLLCSLFLFTEQYEAHLYKLLNKTMKRKTKEYEQGLEAKSSLEIFAILDVNLSKDNYPYSEESLVKVYDCVSKSKREYMLDEERIEKLKGKPLMFYGNILKK